MSTQHVILLTYGEPATPDFRQQLSYSWRILRNLTRLVAPIPAPVVPLIALSRARTRNRMWTEERYGSPIEAITGEQAALLEQALRQRDPGGSWRVHVGYEFRRPLLEDLLASLPAGDPVAILPMYAADSEFTHELARFKLAGRFGPPPPGAARARVVPALDPDYLAELSVAHIRAELAVRGIVPGPDWAVLLTAHGTLLTPPRPMKTGREETEAVAHGIERRLEPEFGAVIHGWLNHVLGGEWTKPPGDEAMADLVSRGFRKVIYFPYGFLADNAESQLEGRAILRAHPGVESHHLPCLNTNAALIDALAGAVLASAAEPVGA